MTRIDTIHDTLATGHGCHHPKVGPAECARVADALYRYERPSDVPPPGWDDEDEDEDEQPDLNREGDPAFNGAFDRW